MYSRIKVHITIFYGRKAIYSCAMKGLTEMVLAPPREVCKGSGAEPIVWGQGVKPHVPGVWGWSPSGREVNKLANFQSKFLQSLDT